MRRIIKQRVGSEAVSFIDDCPKLARGRLKSNSGRIPDPSRVDFFVLC